jgi:hypothetical protein
MTSFKDWLVNEGGDIFGFEKAAKISAPEKQDQENPIQDIHCDVVMEFLSSVEVNGKRPIVEFSSQVRWGEDTGAVQMVVSPFGSYKSIIRRLQPDLEGKSVWACKKILPYKEILDANRKVDEHLANVILKHIEAVSTHSVEAPSHEYDGLVRLVNRMSRVAQRRDVIPEIMIYKGSRELKRNEHYIIVFEVRGHGVEAPGSARVEQFHIEMCYDPKTGMIRSFGHDIQSPTKGHVWYPQPSEWDEKFSSGQDEDEIVDCISAALSTY